jgi:lambda family phage tail tape measure protein
MADLNYTVDVNTTKAINSLKKVEKEVTTLNNVFLKLKTTLATVSFGAAISGTLRFADAIQDISDTTGIATQTILGFSNAVAQNGGNADQAQQSLLKFVQTIGEAIDGSNSAQKALADVGITLKDIQTLSEQELLQRTVDGLGKMTNATQRLAVQTALFGKNARGVNFPGVAGGMGTAVAEASQYAAAIKSGADAQQSLENNLRNLTTALLTVIKPLNDIIKSVNISVSAFESLIKAIVYATAAYLAFIKGPVAVTTVMDKLKTVLKTNGGLFALITLQFKRMGSALLSVVKGVGRATGVIAGGTSALFSFSAAIAGALRFLLRFAGVVSIILAVAEAVNFLSKTFFNFDIIDYVINKFKALYDIAAKYFNLSSSNKTTKELEKQTQAQKDASAAAEAFAERQAKLADDIKKTTSAYATVNGEQLKNLQTETELIGKSEQEQEMTRAINDLYSRQVGALNQLLQKRAEYAKGTEEQKASLGVIDAEIQKVIQLTAVQREALPKYISDLQSARLLEQDRVNNLDRITQALQRQQDQAGITSGIFSNLQKQLGDVKFGKEQQGRSVFQQQEEQIKRNIVLLENDMAAAVTEAFTTEDGITNVVQYGIELNKVYALTEQLKQAQLEELNISRQWSTGWTDAFNKYIESATNAATKAGEMFNAVTTNMNSAIDNFVENGKFSFGDLAKSIIKDLLKIELKKQAAFAMGSFRGGGGILSGIASIFGFANGGSPPVGKPSIVGENGPELFIPRTAGTVIPNGGGTGQVINNYITNNNVSAIDAKSVAQFFAENRKTMLGTVELARKEMPYGNR